MSDIILSPELAAAYEAWQRKRSRNKKKPDPKILKSREALKRKMKDARIAAQ